MMDKWQSCRTTLTRLLGAKWPTPNFLFLLMLLALLQLVPVTFCFFIDERQSPNIQHWSYEDQQAWRADHKQCGAKAQSPIDIQRRFVTLSNQLKLYFYNYNQLTKFKIQNAHHTIRLSPVDTSLHHFGLKLNGPTSDGGSGGGDDGFNSSIPDIMTADEDSELELDTTRALNPQQQSPSQPLQHSREQSRVIVDSHLRGQQQQHQQQQQPGAPRSYARGGIRPPATVAHHNNGANNIDEQANEVPPYNGAPTIKLDWLDDDNNEYKLRDIHFHWGERRDNGSEHAIDGRRAAMEMHLVHVKHGLDKSKIGYTSDSVAVIAILIESYRKSNADFNPIVNALSRINMTNHEQEIEYKSINDLLPNVLTSFYTYSGSLTTPPCYQVVNWIVMSDRLYLNAKQIEMFRNLYAPLPGASHHPQSHQSDSGGETHHGHESSDPPPIMPNIRHIQPLNNRTILASFAPLSRLEQIQADSAYSSANSFVSLLQTTGVISLLIWAAVVYAAPSTDVIISIHL